MTKWRLLDTGAMPASLNMAIDEALLQLHVPGESQPTLRFYSWDPPAVSLGYFQRHHAIDLASCRELGIDVVRRATGGRAVLHQNDLTYSVVADSGQGIPSTLEDAYHVLCQGFLAGFRLLGFEAEIGREERGTDQEDICFVHAAFADVVYQGRKFLGSAQTWRGASLLQHGSIVLEPQEETWSAIFKTNSRSTFRDTLKARIVSLHEILGRDIDPVEVKQAVRMGMTEALQIVFEIGDLSPQEETLAKEISSKKQRAADAERRIADEK